MTPLMIWSTRTLMASHACRSASSMPAARAATRPISSGQVMPKTGRSGSLPRNEAAAAAMIQPTKAPTSMMPSMPMLTTPERSHSTPQSAARAMGTATRTDVWARMGSRSRT